MLYYTIMILCDITLYSTIYIPVSYTYLLYYSIILYTNILHYTKFNDTGCMDRGQPRHRGEQKLEDRHATQFLAEAIP